MPQIQKKPRSGMQRFVEQLLVHEDMDKQTLAARLRMKDGTEWSPQLLSKRLQTGRLTTDEIAMICDAIGAKVSFSVTYSDGKTDLYAIN